MNMSTLRKEDKYYVERSRSGTSFHYKQNPLNRGSLTFSVYVFKDMAYSEHGKTNGRDFRKTSKIPSILFSRYKFSVLRKIN